MAKVKDYDMEAMEELCDLGKALSSPIRLKILQLLYEESLIIGEIARKLELPASSTAFHLKILEEAGLIRIEEQPGTRGNTRLCTRKVDHVTINLVKKNTNVTEVFSEEMPVGAFTSCQICLLYTSDLRGIEVVLTRRNTFGPLHELPKKAGSYGPYNFLTEGDHWSEEYVLYEQGLLGEVRMKG